MRAANSQPDDRRHARVVPPGDQAPLHQLQQLALAHHGVGEVQPREFNLAGLARHGKVVDGPVVERPVILELERAERVRDVLDRIRDGMRVVVHRVDAPRVTGAMVGGVPDAVDHGVAQVQVRRRHVDLRAEHFRAVLELALPHPFEQVEALRGRPAPPRALPARLGQRAAVLADLVGRQLVHVGLVVANQAQRVLVDLLEVIGGVEEALAPVESEPVDALDDRVHVLDVFLGRIGVVEAQVARAAELLRDAEVQADGLGVPDVEIAVGLGGKSRGDAVVLPGSEVVRHDLSDEIERRRCRRLLRRRAPAAAGGVRNGHRGSIAAHNYRSRPPRRLLRPRR